MVGTITAFINLQGGSHRKGLRYSKSLPNIKETDQTAIREVAVVFASELTYLTYLVLALIWLGSADAATSTLETNYISLVSALSLCLLTCAALCEMKQWVKQCLKLNCANNLVGEELYNV